MGTREEGRTDGGSGGVEEGGACSVGDWQEGGRAGGGTVTVVCVWREG